jgi:hypothetical protein
VGVRRRRRRRIQSPPDRFQNSVQILGELMVPESENFEALAAQDSVTYGIVFSLPILGMLTAV